MKMACSLNSVKFHFLQNYGRNELVPKWNGLNSFATAYAAIQIYFLRNAIRKELEYMTNHLIIPGTRQDYALLIKGGQGGSACGYQNKYLNLANEIRSKYGITVVSCAIRDKPKSDNQVNQIAEDVDLVNSCCKSHPKIFFMGMSKGASLGCIEGSKIPQIIRLLLINPPLMINLPRICRSAKNFSGEMMTFVFGSEDPSIKESGLLKLHERDNMKVVTIPGQDHYFSKDGFNLMVLVEEHLLFNLKR